MSADVQDLATLELEARLLRGLGDVSRLTILVALRQAPRCVSDFVAMTGMTQPNVSNHLACLRDCGLVVGQPQGRHVIYSLADTDVADLLDRAGRVLQRTAGWMEACSRLRAVDKPARGQGPKNAAAN
jgi:DNA-binding transcriptional ArsR family regulator